MPNTDKRNRFKATVIAAAIAILPLASHAAGLGKITVLSVLGQPLKAEIEVTANRDELPSLVARVAAADAFRQAGIDYSPAMATLRFSRDVKERGGRRYLEITSDRPLNEPFIDMLVELNWASGRLVREYTFLLDPPGLTQKMSPAPVAAPEVRSEPAMACVERLVKDFLCLLSAILNGIHPDIIPSQVNRHSNTHDIAIVAQVDAMRGWVVRQSWHGDDIAGHDQQIARTGSDAHRFNRQRECFGMADFSGVTAQR